MLRASPWFIVAFLLLVICLGVLHYSKNKLEFEFINIKEIKNADKEILTFLLVYLLPLVTQNTSVAATPELTFYVFIIIAWAVYHSNAFFFNPLLGLSGYHFYEIISEDGMTHMLITTKTIRKTSIRIEVTQLFDFIYLATDKEEDI